MPTNDSSALSFHEAALDCAVARTGPLGAAARAALAPFAEECRADGMTAVHAGALMAAVHQEARAAFEAGLSAFQALAADIEALDSVLQQKHVERQLLDRMLATRVSMSEVFHFLSKIAGKADIPEVQRPAETAAMLEGAKADLERFRADDAAPAPAMEPPERS